jgi:thiamine biosynthesis lipoprotein
MPPSSSNALTLARNAMATRFEIVLPGNDSVKLRAAGEEALDEIERIEAALSFHRPTSEIAHINARASRGPVRVSPEVFALLQQSAALAVETGGAFDITIAPLLRCWGFIGGSGRMPDPSEIDQARARVGMRHVHLDAESFTVRFDTDGVMIDLGSIGKGYALDQAARVLKDSGINRALLHGGTSTVVAIGQPDDSEPWKIAVDPPPDSTDSSTIPLAVIPLRDEALSVSAVWGKSFQSGDRRFGHVLDPRTGQPAVRAELAAVTLSEAMVTDALSTALLIDGVAGLDPLIARRPAARALVIGIPQSSGSRPLESRGIEIQNSPC